MAIPCKRPATQQRARRRGQNVQVIVSRLLSALFARFGKEDLAFNQE
jgi:hypothetical protein